MRLRTAERLDPLRSEPVLVGAAGARDAAVGDVPHEQMPEGVLGLPLDRRAALPADEVLALERAQVLLDRSRRRAAEVSDGADPERPAEDRGVLDDGLLPGGQRVESRGDDALDGGRHGQLARGHVEAAFRDHAHELLCVERVAAGTRQQRPLELGRQHGLLEQLAYELRGVRVAQGLEAQHRRALEARSPRRPLEEQIGPSGAEHEQRHAGGPADEVLQEVEQPVAGPVEILEHEHERALLGQALEEAPPGAEDLLPIALGLSLRGEADERPQVRLDPRRLVSVAHRVGHLAAQLVLDLARGVRVENPGLRLDHLQQGRERDALPVGQAGAATPRDELGVVLDDRR